MKTSVRIRTTRRPIDKGATFRVGNYHIPTANLEARLPDAVVLWRLYRSSYTTRKHLCKCHYKRDTADRQLTLARGDCGGCVCTWGVKEKKTIGAGAQRSFVSEFKYDHV
ncbi:hypothetical protein EVAR_86853_1 [Eumeta japonica]|uniref:Uncharacterized protein n=1 Tax=Eumeta variegata TaxID=151549 RepID=A0A4C1VT54_EUMVA|nr:hypothetical protein EVAR_86853_1 [Eumeta japonica]